MLIRSQREPLVQVQDHWATIASVPSARNYLYLEQIAQYNNIQLFCLEILAIHTSSDYVAEQISETNRSK